MSAPVSTNPPQSEAASLLRSAVESHRRGQTEAAERSYRACISLPGFPAEAAGLLGLLLQDQGRLREAVDVLTNALLVYPDSAFCRSSLGSVLLLLGEWSAASHNLAAAARSLPDDADVQLNLGTARKNLGDLAGAVAAFRSSLVLRRGFGNGGNGLTDGATNGVKLEHDLQQVRMLAERYPERADFKTIADALTHELSANGRYRSTPFQMIPLGNDSARRIGWFYNRLVHEPQVSLTSGALARPDELTALTQAMDEQLPFIVIDDFLGDEALAGLRKLCEESTFWFEPKDHGGHVGAYLHEGFDHPLIMAIADQTQGAARHLLDKSVLKQAWAYKYDNRGAGTRIHADQAAYTLNLWITQDGPDCSGGGLEMTDVAAPPDWTFDRYNANSCAIEAYLHQQNATCTRIAHRANRAVFFKSNYFHATEAFQFGSAYLDRRVNVSFMFGGA